MSGKGLKMKALTEMIESCQAKISQLEKELDGQKRYLAGLQDAYNAYAGILPPLEPVDALSIKKRANIKSYVMDIVFKNAVQGVTAAEIVQTGRAGGRALNQQSVSSLLSRWKRLGALKFESDRYFPTKSEVKVITTVSAERKTPNFITNISRENSEAA